MLPSILLKAVILAAAGMIAFCAVKWSLGRETARQVQIGYVAETDRLTEMAVSYVENMESVQDWCSLLPVSEEEGQRLLAQGELAALLVLPDNVVEEILTGSNAPAKLYLSDQAAPLGLLFEELAGAAVGILQTAQAEIYATHSLAEQFGCGQQALEEMYGEIDRFNLRLAMNREQYFRIRTLSVTGSESLAVYYGSALFTVYLLLAGLFFGSYLWRSDMEQAMLAKRAGISYGMQLSGRFLVTAGLLAIVLLLPGFLWLIPGVRQLLQAAFSVKSLFLLLLSLFCMAAWFQLVYLLAGSRRVAVLVTAVTALISGYGAGCFLPTALLPKAVNGMGAVLPAAYIKAAFTMLFTGETSSFAKTAAALFCWTLLLWLAGILTALARSREIRGSRRPLRDRNRAVAAGRLGKSQSLFGILAKRLLFQKSLWVCLLLTVLVSVIIVKAEQRSEATVYAAVYTEEEACRRLLAGHEGLVEFIFCESEEEVKRNVIQGKAECGYLLQEDLQKEIASGNGNWAITVYESADSTMTRVVNEVLFERLFYEISSDWFAGYIAEQEHFAPVRETLGEEGLGQAAAETLTRKLHDGSTFTFARMRVPHEEGPAEAEKAPGEAGAAEKGFTYPIRSVAVLCILLCGCIGMLGALADKRAGRRFGGRETCAAVLTVCQPLLCGLFAGIIAMAAAGAVLLQDVLFLLGIAMLAMAGGVVLQWGIGKLLCRR